MIHTDGNPTIAHRTETSTACAPLFTDAQRDVIAEVLRSERERAIREGSPLVMTGVVTWWTIIRALWRAFQEDDPNFDALRFVALLAGAAPLSPHCPARRP